MARRFWSCRKCGHRQERSASRKCAGCGALTKPKARVPKHAETLRDDSYDVYEKLSVQIHGGDLGACGYCRRPKPDHGRHERDHDHRTGKPRGLACFQCNRERLRHHTLETMRAGIGYLERVEAFYEQDAAA